MGKVTLKNPHSTDTDPEAEIYNNKNILSKSCLNSNNQMQQEHKNIKNPKNKMKMESAFQNFIDDLPSYEYDQHQIRKNQLKKRKIEKTNENRPMNMIDTNNNRFLNYYEAFLYIAEHCIKHGQKFTQENVKQYLKQCYIIDFAHDNFIPITTHLTQKLFNKYFRLIQRELKFI